jgi:biopolymer transport protein ExbD
VKFARSSRRDVDINLTPLIDVVFLLLIFFMVSTTFTKETHLSIDLPEATGEPLNVSEKQVEITVSESGAYTVNGTALVDNKIETLKEAIEKASDGDNTLPMTITADSQATHQSVVTAMDAAGQLGFTELAITTRNRGDDESG